MVCVWSKNRKDYRKYLTENININSPGVMVLKKK